MKKKFLLFTIIILIVILVVVLVLINKKSNIYSFSEDTFSYSQDRDIPKYDLSLISTNDSLSVYSVNFTSRSFLTNPTIIYGLIFIPTNKVNLPGLVLLPGGGETKEQESKLALKIASQGYAVITIDQRGVGQTQGLYPSLDQDYQEFSQGNEPVQHLSVYDALATFDVLRSINSVNKDNIAIAGESMGGRYAIIAAAQDSRLKGVIAISAAGFHIQKDPSISYNSFLISIDPDHYIDKISPRKLYMFQSTNDSVVPFQEAEKTFSIAKEPKQFIKIEGCNHGYCEKMDESLKSALKDILQK